MDAAIDRLLAARRDRTAVPPLGALAPADVAAGYALQRGLAERVGALPPAGFKLGATARRMQEYLGLSGPAAGFMAAADLHASGAAFRLGDYRQPGIECEIAVTLGQDLPAGRCTPERAGDAVASLHAAIEVVDRRYDDLAALGTPTLIADQVFHAACVLGPAVDPNGIDPAALRGALLRDGAEWQAGWGRDLLGHPYAALAWLVASPAAAAFGGLRAGQVVMLGSVTPPLWLDGPAALEAAFDRLGSATVRFTNS